MSRKLWLFSVLWAFAVIGCGDDAVDVAVDTVSAVDSVAVDTVSAVDSVGDVAESGVAQVVLLHTSDEHGYVAGVEGPDGAQIGGVAELLAVWARDEPPERLVLSGGDVFLGAAVSSWLDGEPAIEAMNAMGYAAMAVGNHEFDKGRALYAARREHAVFPWLAANVVDVETGKHAAGLAERWILREVDGVTVGVIGVAHPDTPWITTPSAVEGLRFDPVRPTLEALVPEVRAAGADVVVVLAHVSFQDLVGVVGSLTQPVSLIFGGHRHQQLAAPIQDMWVIQSGSRWEGYTRVQLDVDRATGEVLETRVTWVPVVEEGRPLPVEAALAERVAGWQAEVDAVLGETIGWLGAGIAPKSWTMANLVTDSWRWRFPGADFAIQNSGGMREALGPGAVTREDVVTTLPFDNVIFEVALTGADIVTQLDDGVSYCANGPCFVATSGLRYERGPAGLEVETTAGEALDVNATYSVLVNSFMYEGGGGFGFSTVASEVYDTSVNYREPVMEWIIDQNSSEGAPFDAVLDGAPRDALE